MNNKTDATAPPEEGAPVLIIKFPRRYVEAAVLAVVLLTAFGFLLGARQIQSRSEDLVGAHTFPAVLSILLIVATAVAIFQALRLPSSSMIVFKRPRGLLFAMALLLVFPALVEYLGYYVLIVPWVLAFGWAARVRSPLLIVITLGTTLFVARFIFEMALGTSLP